MSQFYASIHGNRGAATRQGTKKSGMTGHIRGWNIGVRVECYHTDGIDYVYVYKTSGSAGHGRDEKIAEFSYPEET